MISVVIPLYNESLLAERLLNEVFAGLMATNQSFEVVCVNDGSNDDTLEILLNFREKDTRLKIVDLSRNFGLQAALTAGLSMVNGDYTLLMDGDFQDPPQLIPSLFQKIYNEKADVVSALRKQRKEKFPRKLYFNLFHKIFSNISESRQIENTGNFCILNRKATNALKSFSEKNRYIPGLRNFIGFKHEFIEYERPERLIGKVKMNRRKLVTLAMDAIFSFSKWPVKVCLITGILGIILFLGAIAYTFISKFTGIAPIGWSSTFLAICFFGSVQLTFMGLIGEYVYRIYKEVQNRPLYFIKNLYE